MYRRRRLSEYIKLRGLHDDQMISNYLVNEMYCETFVI